MLCASQVKERLCRKAGAALEQSRWDFPMEYLCLEMCHTIGYSKRSPALYTMEVLVQRLQVSRAVDQQSSCLSCKPYVLQFISIDVAQLMENHSGDQPFWGHMVARAGAGPKPIPYKQLNASLLAESISEALKPSSLDKAKELSEKIRHETGSETGSHSFHRQLNIDNMRCQLSPKRTAVWRVKRTEVRLSAFAATVLGNGDLLDPKELKL